MSLLFDIKIMFSTILKVIGKSDVAEDTNQIEGNFAEIRAQQIKEKQGVAND